MMINLVVLEMLLNKLGFSCQKAYNGLEAIKELENYYKNKDIICTNSYCSGYKII